MECRCGSLFFTSKFDSGNLARVERVTREEEDSEPVGFEARPDHEVNVWTKPDCAGTPYENGNRSWFYFGVRGGCPGKLLKVNIMNMNRQGKLYSQGHAPFVKTVPGKPRWERIRDKPSWESVDNNFILSFTHRFTEPKIAMTYFSFCFPWSYTECQESLDELDNKFAYCQVESPQRPADTIYYHRELLCKSLDNLRVDLITVSDYSDMTKEEEERFDSRLFPDRDKPRCRAFKRKRVYLVSSRVHPGETPSSFVFNGFLEFILRPDDPRAKQLRRQFVFKLIPILNPDGVVRGHYRTDSRGVNLNRMYLDPSFELFPSIYAAKSVLVHHHVHNSIQPPTGSDKNVGDKHHSKNIIKAPSPSGDKAKTAHMCSEVGDISYMKNAAKHSPGLFVENLDDHVLDHSLSAFAGSGQDKVPESGAIYDEGSDVEERLVLQTSDMALSFNEMASGGECQDPDDDLTEHLGNEGSEDEGDNNPPITSGLYAPHLSDPKLLDIKPGHSGIALYVDLHGHASKRGCFIYGNYFEDEDTQVENMLFPKLISVNTAHFDFGGCNFTERNMYLKDKKDGLSKEGAGRVAMYKALGIINSYTLECNYNTGRMVNSVPPAYGDNGRSTPPPLAGFPPKFTQAHYEEVGKAMAIAALDLTETNPWSRLTLSEYSSIHGVRDWVRRHLRGLRGLPKGPTNRPQKQGPRSTTTTASSNSAPFIPRVALLAQRQRQQESTTQPVHSQGGSDNTIPQKAAQATLQRRLSNVLPRRELAPVREPPRATAERARRRISSTGGITATTSPTNTTVATMTSPRAVTSPPGATGPSLHHSMSTPVTLNLTCNNVLKNSSRTDQPKPFLPNSVSSAYHMKQAREVVPPSGRSVPAAYPHRHTMNVTDGRRTSNTTEVTMKSPDNSSVTSLEEEKVQQLKNIPSYNVRSTYQVRNAKPLEPPKSDPVKRKNKKGSGSKRRSNSCSPKSASKGLGKKATSSLAAGGNDSDTEKSRNKGRKAKTIMGRAKYGRDDDTLMDMEDILEAPSRTDTLRPTVREPAKISPREEAIRRLLRGGEVMTQVVLTQPGPSNTAGRSKKKKKKKWLSEKKKAKSTAETEVKVQSINMLMFGGEDGEEDDDNVITQEGQSGTAYWIKF